MNAVLLKGPSHASRLYPPGSRRAYVDTDVLVDPNQLTAARALLSEAGYDCVLDERDAAHPLHASEWRRSGDAHAVDLHWSLPGAGASRSVVWQALLSSRGSMHLLGEPVQALDDPGIALHVGLHAAHNGPRDERAMEDLDRALEQLSPDAWERAAVLAAALDAEPAFAAGLRLTPAGARLADTLALAGTTSVELLLRARSAPSSALAIERLARARGARQRARLLTRELIPTRRALDYPAALSQPLAVAYVQRALRLAQELPAAVRAWRAARRDVNADAG